MTQATLTRPQTTIASPEISLATPPAMPAAESKGLFATIVSGIKRAPWTILFLAPIGAAPLYVAFDSVGYGFGMILASVPILAAAAFLLSGVLSLVLFADQEEH